MKPRNKEDVKPFDLNLVHEGHPICQMNGEDAHISYFDMDENYNLGGRAKSGDFWRHEQWCSNGRAWIEGVSDNDLVLAPLGYCQEKPVFAGDVLVSHRAEKLIISASMADVDFDKLCYTWPRKEPVMPKLRVDVDKIKCMPGIMADMQWKELFDIANPVLSFVLTYQTDEVIDYLVESGKVVRVMELDDGLIGKLADDIAIELAFNVYISSTNIRNRAKAIYEVLKKFQQVQS